MKVKGEAVFVKDIKDWISNAKLFKLDSKVYYDKGGKQKKALNGLGFKIVK